MAKNFIKLIMKRIFLLDLIAKGVLISYNPSTATQSSQDNNSTFTGSGIHFGEKWVLTHGSLFSGLNIVKDVLKYQTHSPKLNTNKRYNIFPRMYIQMEDHTDSINFLNNITVHKGRVVYIWKCHLLNHVLKNIMGNWKIGNKTDNENIENDDKHLFPIIALIEITKKKDVKSADVNVRDVLVSLYNMVIKRTPIRGDEIQLECTPFGNEVFINSLTNGTICNSFGPENCAVLCDASSTLCCEGGPAFTLHEKGLFGMIINSLSWCRGEWVGLTLIVYLAPILHHHLFQNHINSQITSYMPLKHLILSHLLDSVDSTVIRIRCGSSWGSGIALGKGFVLTCSHVVEHKSSNLILKCKGKIAKAQIVFKSSDHNAYDLALLYTNSKEIALIPAKFSQHPAIKGETVVAIGFPYFDEHSIINDKPTITRGRVNNVNPYGLQTSCCIQAGYSGGAIMRISKEIGSNILFAELLGIIVCNTKDHNNNVSFPNVNMAIPSHIVKKPIEDFINKNSLLPLYFEGNTNQVAKSFWEFKLQKSHL